MSVLTFLKGSTLKVFLENLIRDINHSIFNHFDAFALTLTLMASSTAKIVLKKNE